MNSNYQPFSGEAFWIWSEEGLGSRPLLSHDNYRVRYFRREFTIEQSSKLTAHVSADSRYVLYCNGILIDRGPARGDIAHHFYETYDLTPYLHEGENVLAAMVVYCGDVMPTYHTTGAPCGLMTAAPGFIVDALLTDDVGNVLESLHSNEQWQVRSDTGAYRHEHCAGQGSYTGFTERFRGSHYPWGWNQPHYKNNDFEAATKIFYGVRPDTVRDSFMPHRLMPRPIPRMESRPQRFDGVQPANVDWSALLERDETLEIAPETRVVLILHCSALTTAFPRLKWSGGVGTSIRLTYAENLTQGRVRQYNTAPQGDVIGVFDELFPGGGDEEWQSWQYRTFRYVKVEIETGAESLRLHTLDSIFWAYPFQLRSRFASDDPFFSTLLETGFRTLQLCSHETYEDCPYYEQLSYAGDNYVIAQAAALLTGDSRLTAHTLREFFWSRHPEGLTLSRYPCRMPQIIPAWSQLWLLTVRSYYQFTGDLELVREVSDGINSVLSWFERKRENSGKGLVGALNYWCVLDWSPDWGVGTEENGVPPGTYVEASAANNFLHIWCLRSSGELYSAIGETLKAEEYQLKADELALLVHEAFWDAERGLYRDRVSGEDYSQLTNALAILSQTLPREQWEHLAPRLTDPSINRAGYFGDQFVFDAMAKAGVFEQCWPTYEVYRNLIEVEGSTTLPEAPSKPRRSECHAWSTGCVSSLFTHGLGVQPLEAGWSSILVEPQPSSTQQWLTGSVSIPQGEVSIELKKINEKWSLKARVPHGIPVKVRLPEQDEQWFAQGGNVAID
jgi:alpha-L-rhamnosidase